jgi:signal transduction histidine kinase
MSSENAPAEHSSENLLAGDDFYESAEELLHAKAQEITELRTALEQKSEDLELLQQRLERREAELKEREARQDERQVEEGEFLSKDSLTPLEGPKVLGYLLDQVEELWTPTFSAGEPASWLHYTLGRLFWDHTNLFGLGLLDALQKGEKQLETGTVNLEELFEAAREDFARQTINPRIELDTHIREGVPLELKGDWHLLRTVLALVAGDLVQSRQRGILHIRASQDRAEDPGDGQFQLLLNLQLLEPGSHAPFGSGAEVQERKDQVGEDRRNSLGLADRLCALSGGYLWREENPSGCLQICITIPLRTMGG